MKRRISALLIITLLLIFIIPQFAYAALTLRRGSKGSDVSELQKRLKELNFYAGPVDGSFGPQTLSAVKAFQKSRGLAVDGVVGPKTRAALFSDTNTPAPTAPSNSKITITLRKGSKGS